MYILYINTYMGEERKQPELDSLAIDDSKEDITQNNSTGNTSRTRNTARPRDSGAFHPTSFSKREDRRRFCKVLSRAKLYPNIAKLNPKP